VWKRAAGRPLAQPQPTVPAEESLEELAELAAAREPKLPKSVSVAFGSDAATLIAMAKWKRSRLPSD